MIAPPEMPHGWGATSFMDLYGMAMPGAFAELCCIRFVDLPAERGASGSLRPVKKGSSRSLGIRGPHVRLKMCDKQFLDCLVRLIVTNSN